jgi:hypothetical protein
MLRSAISGFRGPLRAVAPDGDAAGSGEVRERLSALVGLLGEERRLLERLVQKLVSCTLLVESGQSRWVAPASDEVHDVEDDLGALETARAMMIADICDLLGFANDLTLSQLSEVAPPELHPALEERRQSLVGYTEEIARMRSRGARAAEAQLSILSDRFDGIDRAADASGYSPAGYESLSSMPPIRFDGSG